MCKSLLKTSFLLKDDFVVKIIEFKNKKRLI